MATNNQILERIKENKLQLGNYYYLFLVQYFSGCRITEALNISVQDLTIDGLILIRGLKKSEDRVVSIPELIPLIRKSLSNNIDPFYSMNRFTAYRLLKNLGIGKLKSNRKRESVTHIFRDNHSKQIRTLTTSKVVLSQSLGHKNIRNTEYYGKD